MPGRSSTAVKRARSDAGQVLLEPLPSLLPTAQAEAKPSADRRPARLTRLTRPTRPTDDQIRRRAYEIYLERGCQPGHHVDDWIQAERELRTRRAA